jgi:hypothetical protein
MSSQPESEGMNDGTLKDVLARLNKGLERLSSERLVNREDAIKRHKEMVGLLRPLIGEPRQAVPVKLNDLERDIVEALGKDTLTGETIAERINRDYDSNLKAALASMRRRGILGNRSPGYYVIHESHDEGQD